MPLTLIEAMMEMEIPIMNVAVEEIVIATTETIGAQLPYFFHHEFGNISNQQTKTNASQ